MKHQVAIVALAALVSACATNNKQLEAQIKQLTERVNTLESERAQEAPAAPARAAPGCSASRVASCRQVGRSGDIIAIHIGLA